MMFMYWTHPEIEAPPAAPAWRKIYPEFRVFTDDDVLPLLPPGFAPVFNAIRLPSAKSDLARLLLLRAHGGLYLDAHVGPTAPARLLETLDTLCAYNLVLFGKGWAMTRPTDFDLMNGVLAARKAAPELDIVIDRLIGNLAAQHIREKNTSDYVPYNLFGLTGTYTLVQSFFDQTPPRPRLKKEFQDTIFIHYMKDNTRSGFEIAAYYSYRKPHGHWSERQTHERLFQDERD